ncbi:MAG: hypothetical protein ACI4AK_01400 [Lepagella sp.]
MKKIFILFSVVIAFALCSCNNEENARDVVETSQNVQLEESKLLSDLTALNDSLIASQPATKSGTRKILSACSIAGADVGGAYEIGRIGLRVGSLFGPKGAIAGALVGGLIGGVGASYAAYRTTRSNDNILSPDMLASAYISVLEDNPNYSLYYPNDITLRLPTGKTNLQEIGVKHNLILEKLFHNEYSTTSLQDGLSSLEVQILSSEEFIQGYYQTINFYKFSDHTTFVSNDGSVANATMRLYLDALYSYPEDLDDIENLSNNLSFASSTC